MTSEAGAGVAPGKDDVELLFLGTGTSAGVPMIGCDCETCTSTDPRDNRTRCSVVISYSGPGGEPVSVLVDTTPELRIQAVANKLRKIDALVFTHAHADHLMGLDDVRRFNSIRRGPLDAWADEATHATLAKVFTYAFREPDPDSALYRPHLVPRTIDGPFEIGGRTWTPVLMIHGDMPVLGFRVDDLAYCTDVSEIPPASMDLLRGLDVLVLDALQFRKHPTHFTVEEALAIVADLKPRRTYFTHMSHGVLHARDEPKLPEGVRFAYDGLRMAASRVASSE
jgi:phosphoribosyl 1,2-cyclic phosphate phosphodiesterase